METVCVWRNWACEVEEFALTAQILQRILQKMFQNKMAARVASLSGLT